MSTRSEIRLFVNGKQKGCIYHHSDGYPDHVVQDINTLSGSSYDDIKSLMKNLSKNHGTDEQKCAYGDKSKKNQGDIEYSYNVDYQKKKDINYFSLSDAKLEIFKHKNEGKIKIFSGQVHKAFDKYVCEKS